MSVKSICSAFAAVLCSLLFCGCTTPITWEVFQNDAAAQTATPEEAPAQVPEEAEMSGASEENAGTSFIYYNQTDPDWADYLYGGRDRMEKYGCGPTALAMVVSNLTDQEITPPEAADWSAKNGYWSAGHGSYHALIPEGAAAYGLQAESLSVKNADAVRTCLSYHKILVFLMGPGTFTETGHFIVLYANNDDGTVRIADPVNAEYTGRSWDPESLLAELSAATDDGGPVWAISPAEAEPASDTVSLK